MTNSILKEINDEIVNESNIFKLYKIIFILLFSITIKEMEAITEIMRLTIALVCSVFMTLVTFKYRKIRNRKENKIIIGYYILSILLTIASLINVRNLLL